MFRAVILPIFRSTRLCVTARGIIHPWCCRHRPATWSVHYTTSCNTQPSAPEDGQNIPKHVELTGIVNKPLLLHLVGCLYYLYFIIFFWDLLNNHNLPLSWKYGEYGELPILPANGRCDLIRPLKFKHALAQSGWGWWKWWPQFV